MRSTLFIKTFFIFIGILGWQSLRLSAQNLSNPGSNHGNKFEQLGTVLSDPNIYRTASGAPGPHYWQQEADYDIRVTVDDEKQQIRGEEDITYTNHSPNPLRYIWLQLDENQHASDAESKRFNESRMDDKMSYRALKGIINEENDYGVRILAVQDATGKPLEYTINYTMMRIELPSVLEPGGTFQFHIKWQYNMVNRMVDGGRGGYEYFEEDGNYLYTVTQWYPRMAVYSDFQGWQNKQFTGRGEFALVFGDFKVAITAPADHIIGATGECQNYSEVLTPEQLRRWQKAQESNTPIEIVTLPEAKQAMSRKATATKTWVYEAINVRDFAFVSSRRLVWDAMRVDGIEGNRPMAMSYYGPEAYGLYRKYSTKVVAHTLQVYSKHTIPYPYPVAISVEAANGMEYPMICFNYGRTEKDGTYSEATKYGMIGVIIHEVGHNFFPMIVNSDERQWTWMDEGLNTFCQYLTEQAWDPDFPSRRGPAHLITDYMRLPKDQLEPIMTNSENIVEFGPNAYAKPATALNILRETIMGRDLFDYAFKEYARRWAFKHPTPADFFRTMEDASAVDLDWFWRGWFFGTDPVDISIDDVRYYRLNKGDLEAQSQLQQQAFEANLNTITRKRNIESGMPFAINEDKTLRDFYNEWDRFALTAEDKKAWSDFYKTLDEPEKDLLNRNPHFYEFDFTNIGGLVMPLILEWTYADGSTEIERIPAYIWRKNENQVTKVFAKSKQVVSVQLDPWRETADIDERNNSWPRKHVPTRFELFKQQQAPRGSSTGGNPMQRAR